MPDAIEMPARRARSEVARQMRLLAVELEKLSRGLCSIAVDCASFATNMRAVATELEGFSPWPHHGEEARPVTCAPVPHPGDRPPAPGGAAP